MTPLPREHVLGWLTARSIARGVPAPVADHGGWRVDTRSESEECRYVFAEPLASITTLAAAIDRPRVPIKLCDTQDVLARLLPARWRFEAPTWMMAGRPVAMPPLAPGYRIEAAGDAASVHVRVLDTAGEVAASGYGAAALGVFAYDRIVTAEGHRRRGLGRLVMAALGAAAPAGAAHVLAATAMGRALYESLGWQVRSAYTTAFIPVD